jgi:EmrB/QacA subfamily drug resistance transporter
LQDTALDPRRWQMLPVILTATFMALFDFFVVNVAAPSLERDLHASSSELQLVVGGYAFSYATGLITGGRLGDLFGYRRLFIGGMAGFALASLLCGLAQNPTELIVARLIQGFAGAAMVPQVLSLITNTFAPVERPRALGYFGMTVGAGSVAGQVIGGLLLQADLFHLGWRSIFLVNVPIGAVAIVLAARLLPRTRSEARPHLDMFGALTVSASLALALIPLVMGQSQGWPAWCWVSLALAGPALAAALWWERRLAQAGGDPIVDLSLFRRRSFSAGTAINAAFMCFFGSFMLGITVLLQSGLGLSPLQSGLSFTPLGVAFALTSLAGNQLRARFGTSVIARGAMVAATGVAALLIELWVAGPAVTVVGLVIPMTVVGIGTGMVIPSLIGVVLTGVDPHRAGAASGVLTTAQQFASATGVAILGVVFFNALGSAPDLSTFTTAILPMLVFDLALLTGALVLTRLLAPERQDQIGILARIRELAESAAA